MDNEHILTPLEIRLGDRAEGSRLLGEIALRKQILERAREEMDEFAVMARLKRVSWVDIGLAAGISYQAAQKKWKPMVEQALARELEGNESE